MFKGKTNKQTKIKQTSKWEQQKGFVRSCLLFWLQILGSFADISLLSNPKPSCEPWSNTTPHWDTTSLGQGVQPAPRCKTIPCYKVRKNPFEYRKYLHSCLLISWLQPRPEIATFPEQGCSPGNVSLSAASNDCILGLDYGVSEDFKSELEYQH